MTFMKETVVIISLICICVAFSAFAGCLQNSVLKSETALIRLDAEGNQQWFTVIENQGYSRTVHYFENRVVQASDGGFFVAGTYQNESSGTMLRAVKIDGAGNVVRDTAYPCSHRDVLSLLEDPNGGHTIYTYDGYACRIDDRGQMTGEKNVVDQLGRQTNIPLTVNAVTQAPDGDVILAATKHPRSENLRIADVSSNGTIVREMIIEYPELETVRSIVRTSDGGFLIGGSAFEGGTQFPDPGGILIAKIDESATVVWDVSLAKEDGSLLSMHEYPERGYAVFCLTEDSEKQAGTAWKITEILISREGEIEEERVVSVTGYPEYVSDQGFILTGLSRVEQGFFPIGRTDLDLIVTKTDRAGNVQWNTTLPWVSTSGRVSSGILQVLQTDDGGYAILGSRSYY